MNVKDTIILLTFLLCILGLIAGVYYNETTEPTIKPYNDKEVVHQDSQKTTIPDLNQKDFANIFDGFFS